MGGKTRTLSPAWRALAAVTTLSSMVGSVLRADPGSAPLGRPDRYRAELRVPASLEPILRYLSPGNDSFPEEKDAEQIAARLGELSISLRQDRGAECLDRLLDPEFRGGRLLPAEAIPVSSQPAFS